MYIILVSVEVDRHGRSAEWWTAGCLSIATMAEDGSGALVYPLDAVLLHGCFHSEEDLVGFHALILQSLVHNVPDALVHGFRRQLTDSASLEFGPGVCWRDSDDCLLDLDSTFAIHDAAGSFGQRGVLHLHPGLVVVDPADKLTLTVLEMVVEVPLQLGLAGFAPSLERLTHITYYHFNNYNLDSDKIVYLLSLLCLDPGRQQDESVLSGPDAASGDLHVTPSDESMPLVKTQDGLRYPGGT